MTFAVKEPTAVSEKRKRILPHRVSRDSPSRAKLARDFHSDQHRQRISLVVRKKGQEWGQEWGKHPHHPIERVRFARDHGDLSSRILAQRGNPNGAATLAEFLAGASRRASSRRITALSDMGTTRFTRRTVPRDAIVRHILRPPAGPWVPNGGSRAR